MINFTLLDVSPLHKVAYAKINYNQEDELFSLLKKKNIKLDGLASFTNNKRKVEWMTIRYLLLEIHDKVDDIVYDDHGKPHFVNSSSHLSISHSQEMVAVAINKKEICGIDIQLISDKIIRIKKKFLNDLELSKAQNDPTVLTMYWSCKEALFKVYGKKDAFLKDNMFVPELKFDRTKGTAKGQINTLNHQSSHNICLLKLDNYMLAYVVNS